MKKCTEPGRMRSGEKIETARENKILVTGAKGQLGSDVVRALRNRGVECLGTDLADFDITDADQTLSFIKTYSPTAVIHCAAYTAVDKAEDEPDLCERINATGTANIAAACRNLDAAMMYISTDYVFPGTGDGFYETGDATGALSVYGRTKRMGEEAVTETLQRFYIVRISWVFGQNGNNFVKTMLRLGREREELRVVDDQIGSPTYTRDLAELLCDMIRSDRYGIYHATNEGTCSWAGFARAIMESAGISCRIVPIRSDEYPTKAVRPRNSRLSKKSLTDNGFRLLPPWKDALERYLDLVLKE